MVRTGGRWKRTCHYGRHLASGLPVCRLRQHGLIERIPRTFRYQVTGTGLAHALFLTRLHDRFLRTGLAALAAPASSTRDLAAATRAYTSAIDDLARQAGLAA